MLQRRRWLAALLLVLGVSGNITLRAQDAAPQARGGREALKLPVVPIAQALQDRNGDTIPDHLAQPIHVRSVVTIGSGVIADDRTQIYFQDDTGGLYLFSRTSRKPLVSAGDIVDVGGIVNQYRGSVEIVRGVYSVVGHTAVPKPIRITVQDAAGWRYYGRLVEMEGTIGGETNEGEDLAINLNDHGHSVDLVIPPKTMRGMPLGELRRGARVAATGVVSIYSVDRPYKQGFRLIVGRPDGVRVTRTASPAWLRAAILSALIAIAAIAVVLAGIFFMRRAGRRRRRELDVLSEVSGTVARAGTNVESLLSAAIGVMSRHQLVDGAIVHLLDHDQLALRGIYGVDAELAREVDTQIQSRVPTPLVKRDSGEAFTLPLLHPLLCIPLHGRSRAVGLLTVFTSTRHTVTPEEASTVAAAANVIALGVENIQVLEEAEQQQNELKQLAITDPLTGLYNRRFLDEYLRIHIPMAKRLSAPVAFIAIDLDHFKEINDNFGHETGDTILREFGATVRRLTRASDLPVRLGGEEFLVVMPDTSEAGAVKFAERLQEELHGSAFAASGAPAGFHLTASIGIALYPDHGEQVPPLLRAADGALYESKRAGRDRVTVAPMPFQMAEV